MEKERQYDILMADVIRSRNQDGERLMQDLEKLVEEVAKINPARFLSPMTITLGDEFQAVVRSAVDAVEIMFSLEEQRIMLQLPLKLRYVLHRGVIETPINTKSAHGMLGKGLTKAREHLGEIKKTGPRFFFSDSLERSELLNDGFLIYANFIDEWKEKDFPMISHFLAGKDYYEIAAIMDLNRGYTWRKEKSLNIEPYLAIKNIIKTINNL